MQTKKIFSGVLISFAALTTFTFVTPTSAHASQYVSGVPSVLKNKTWQTKYFKFYGKGGGSAAHSRITFKVNGDKILTVNDFIYNGKHSIYKDKITDLKYKKVGKNKYDLKSHSKHAYVDDDYTLSVISNNHIKINLDTSSSRSYYAK